MKTNKPQNSKAGRPSFQINGKRLRQIRESKGFTQEQLMQLVQQHSGKDTRHTSSETLKTSYRRWEKTGHIHPKNAECLAQILRITMAVLQGQAPAAAQSRFDAITARIQERLDAGHQPLQEMLDAEAATELHTIHISMGGSAPHDKTQEQEHQQHLRFVAERLTQRMEYAQLSQDQNELQELSDLFGYSLIELQQPVSEDGLWLLLQDGGAAAQPRLFQGIHALQFDVINTIKTHLEGAPCDSRIAFQQEGPWFRIQIIDRHLDEKSKGQVRLSFVRSQASESGLQWTQPTWREEFSLQDLESALLWYSNYVKGLDAREKGPSNLANLKLAVYQRPSRAEFEQFGLGVKDKLVAIGGGYREQIKAREDAAGNLSEVEITDYIEGLKKTLDHRAKTADAHDLVTQWLCSNLLNNMQALLSDWPLQYWQFKACKSRIDIQLDAPP